MQLFRIPSTSVGSTSVTLRTAPEGICTAVAKCTSASTASCLASIIPAPAAAVVA